MICQGRKFGKWNPFQKGDGRGFRLAIADLPLPPFPGSAVLVLDFSEAEVMKRAPVCSFSPRFAAFSGVHSGWLGGGLCWVSVFAPLHVLPVPWISTWKEKRWS